MIVVKRMIIIEIITGILPILNLRYMIVLNTFKIR
jgi:hypothetical protein